MNKNTKNLTAAVIVFSVISAILACHYYLYQSQKNIYLQSVELFAKSIQKNIHNDIVSGNFRDLEQKIGTSPLIDRIDILSPHCRSYLDQTTFIHHCSELATQRGETNLVTPVFFDSNGKAIAAYIYLRFNQSALKQMKLLHLLALIALLLLLFCITKSGLIWLKQQEQRAVRRTAEMLENTPLSSRESIIREANNHSATLRPIFLGIETILKRLEKVNKSYEEQKMHAILGKIASQVAHDIRSPLSSMQSALRYFNTVQHHDPNFFKYINLLQLSAARLSGIAEDLLEQNEEEHGVQCNFSIHYILDTLIGEYESRDECQHVSFVKQYADRDLRLFGNAHHLQRALGNLAKNALEAMQGQGTYTVRTTADSHTLTLSLTDTGCGMSRALLAKVLQGGHSEGKEDGHGIGMSVVRDAIEKLGGRLTAHSTIGKGTTFVLQLPLAAQDHAKTTDSAFTITLGMGPTVLVVDDEPSMREQWRLLLEEHGFQTQIFSHYEALASQMLDTKKIAGAIVDFHFDNSERSGFDIITWLHKQGIAQTTLCTAEYWKPSIQQRAAASNITLCPKPIPAIEFAHIDPSNHMNSKATDTGDVAVASTAPRVLVIDDDEGIRLAWSLEADSLGVAQVDSYESMEAMQATSPNLANYTHAFVDKNIPQSTWSLAQTITHLKGHGDMKIIVASGESQADLEKDQICAEADAVLSEKMPRDAAYFQSLDKPAR